MNEFEKRKNKELKELLIEQVNVLDKKFHEIHDLDLQIKVIETTLHVYLNLQELPSIFPEETQLLQD